MRACRPLTQRKPSGADHGVGRGGATAIVSPYTPDTVELAGPTGLPLALRPPGELVFRDGLPSVTPAERSWDELRPVVRDAASCPEGTAYLMYRDVCWPGDRPLLERAGLRYDLTVIPPAAAGREPVRTHGHYHPLAPGGELTYPELYQVVHGEAWFLLQRPGPGGAAALLAVRAKVGDYVLVPPGFGHVTVNVGEGTLVVANWVERHFTPSFSQVRERRGLAYHLLRHGGGVELVPNEAYRHPVPVRVLDAFPVVPPGLGGGVASYPLGRDPARLGFLVDPSRYRAVLAEAWPEAYEFWRADVGPRS